MCPMTNPTVHLHEAVVTEGLATPRFFNGRLLSGEALMQLQSSEQAKRQRLGRALGPGVIDGLWVRDAGGATATLRVLAGEALTARGEVLRLAQDVEVALHAAPTGGAGAEAEGAGFHARPQEAPPNVAAVPGVFVLIAGLTQQPRGRAPASGGAGDGRCNVREDVEGVSFRLASVISPSPLAAGTERFRGDVAALCFGVAYSSDPWELPYGPPCLQPEEALGPSEVALAVVHVNDDGVVAFVDVWAVRRRPATPAPMDPLGARWGWVFGDARRALAEAMTLQFSGQLEGLSATATLAEAFAWLPPAGVIPLAQGDEGAWRRLLGPMAPALPKSVTRESLYGLLDQGLSLAPISTSGPWTPVEVYVASDLAVFVRSHRARLRVSGDEGNAGNTLRVRPVDPEDPMRFLESASREAVRRVADSKATYTIDLEPGTYALEVDGSHTSLPATVSVTGGEVHELQFPAP